MTDLAALLRSQKVQERGYYDRQTIEKTGGGIRTGPKQFVARMGLGDGRSSSVAHGMVDDTNISCNRMGAMSTLRTPPTSPNSQRDPTKYWIGQGEPNPRADKHGLNWVAKFLVLNRDHCPRS